MPPPLYAVFLIRLLGFPGICLALIPGASKPWAGVALGVEGAYGILGSSVAGNGLLKFAAPCSGEEGSAPS